SWNSRSRRAQPTAQPRIRSAKRNRQTSPTTMPDYLAQGHFRGKFAVRWCTPPLHLERVRLQARRCPDWRERLRYRDASGEPFGTRQLPRPYGLCAAERQRDCIALLLGPAWLRRIARTGRLHRRDRLWL